MSFTSGSRIGAYEIGSPLGVGGMGEVYRARDTKLNRDVALKVLPEAFTLDPDRLARFRREAQVLASLNHPNIAAIYGFEESGTGGGPDDGIVRALVLELVEGPTLAERLAHGPLPLEEALLIARQIAEALEAAHDKGIVHRDLKPANVKAPPDAPVKVLDLGLALALPGLERESIDSSKSPTLTIAATEMGLIMGTAAYMSPEQASGKRVDKRADIWSFGVVLWEMLTGRVLFDGETVSHTLADVLRAPIDFANLPATTPGPIREVLTRCLDRDVKTRLRDIGEVRIAIQKWIANPVAISGEVSQQPRLGRVQWFARAVAGVMALALAALAIVHLRETPLDTPVTRSSVLPPDEASGFVLNPNVGGTAISPDGRLLAFAASVKGKAMLWVRPLDSLSARMLPGSEDAGRPFWSPDSRHVGFYQQGKLRRIGLTEGSPRTICDLTFPRGAAWNSDGVIVLSLARPGVIARVPASGGTPVPMTALKGRELDHYWPQFLPDGKHFVFVVRSREDNGDLSISVRVASIDDPPGGNGALLVKSAYGAVFAPRPADPRTGYLLFVQGTSLMAQGFDPTELRLSGEAEPVGQDIGGTESNAYVDLSASRTGVLAYGTMTQGLRRQRSAWVDLNGKAEPFAVGGSPRLSPDGRFVVMTRGLQGVETGPGGRADVVLIDLMRPTNERLLTFSGGNRWPIWSPDSREIVYSVAGTGLFRKTVGESGEPRPLPSIEPNAEPFDWSSDGRFLLYWTLTADKTRFDLRFIPMEPAAAAGPPATFLAGLPAASSSARFSPNRTGQRWVAYHSRDLGGVKASVFIRDFPGARRQELIALDGEWPVWSSDGKTIFFRRGNTLLSVAIKLAEGGVAIDAPKPVLTVPGLALPGAAGAYDVGPDGRLLTTVVEEETGQLVKPITLVLNWQAALKR